MISNLRKTSLNQKIIEPLLIKLNEKNILNRKLIFSINSGRSGSNYLAELLGTAEEVISHHENRPTMSGDFTKMVNTSPYLASFNSRKVKNEKIKRELVYLPKNKVYCETNHMFIKTFYDVILSEFKNVKVVVLRRDLAKVLKSFIELGYFSEKKPYALGWMTSPNSKTSALRAIGADEEMDQFDRCIAYLIDIEARAIRFQAEYPWVKCYSTKLESLNDTENVKNMFNKLDISFTLKTQQLIGKAVNQRGYKKQNISNHADLQYCRYRIKEYINFAQSMNITIPDTLAIN